MAYRPYIKSTDGSLTDIPLQAEVAVKLGTTTKGNTKQPIYLSNGVPTLCTNIVDLIYPVGSIYMSVNSTNPGTLFGGTWTAWGQGRVPVGIGSNGETNYTKAETTGGSENSVANHNHNISQNTGGTFSYNNNGVIYGNGYTNAPGGVSGNVTLNSNWNNALGNWADGGNTQRGRDVGANYSIKNVVIDATGATGGNRQPFITCYMWKRTA